MEVPTKCCSNPNCPAVNPQSAFEFLLHKYSSDGLQSRCKTCRKLYYEVHKKEILQRQKLYKETHIEEHRQYREEHKEKIRQYNKLYQEEHKEETRKKYFDKRDTQNFIDIMVAINIVNEKLANKRSEAC